MLRISNSINKIYYENNSPTTSLKLRGRFTNVNAEFAKNDTLLLKHLDIERFRGIFKCYARLARAAHKAD